jgi:hypothetical protein
MLGEQCYRSVIMALLLIMRIGVPLCALIRIGDIHFTIRNGFEYKSVEGGLSFIFNSFCSTFDDETWIEFGRPFDYQVKK